MPRIAVDAMGGDHAPQAVIEGAALATREFGVEVILVGDQEMIARELAHYPNRTKISVVPATEFVPMHESPSLALRKKQSSMRLAFDLMKHRKADAVVSAGNSGAMMALGMFVMGTLPQVARPAILIVVPSLAKGTVIIDAGANVDCKQRHLVQFGLMGSIYAERILGIASPRIGVLSNGEEDSKGNDLTRAASEELSATTLNYIGYVEGRDIFNGKVDVIVCDGFTGNIALKTMDGVAIIAHGGSNSLAIKNAIRAAASAVDQQIYRHIGAALAESPGAGTKKEGLSRKLWERFKSKIESLGEKTDPEPTPEERRRGDE